MKFSDDGNSARIQILGSERSLVLRALRSEVPRRIWSMRDSWWSRLRAGARPPPDPASLAPSICCCCASLAFSWLTNDDLDRSSETTFCWLADSDSLPPPPLSIPISASSLLRCQCKWIQNRSASTSNENIGAKDEKRILKSITECGWLGKCLGSVLVWLLSCDPDRGLCFMLEW